MVANKVGVVVGKAVNGAQDVAIGTYQGTKAAGKGFWAGYKAARTARAVPSTKLVLA